MKKEDKKEPKEERKVEMPNWNGYSITDPSHAHDLEQRTAMYEFQHKLPNEQAQKQAHADYKHEQHLKAAAKHFSGYKAAKAVGDHEEGQKHLAMYTLHLQQLGHDPSGAVPKEVEHHMGDAKKEPFYRFQSHLADGFLLNDGTKKKDKK